MACPLLCARCRGKEIQGPQILRVSGPSLSYHGPRARAALSKHACPVIPLCVRDFARTCAGGGGLHPNCNLQSQQMNDAVAVATLMSPASIDVPCLPPSLPASVQPWL